MEKFRCFLLFSYYFSCFSLYWILTIIGSPERIWCFFTDFTKHEKICIFQNNFTLVCRSFELWTLKLVHSNHFCYFQIPKIAYWCFEVQRSASFSSFFVMWLINHSTKLLNAGECKFTLILLPSLVLTPHCGKKKRIEKGLL